jgi:D-glycero-D-manno-heptose 1,7-bisphosphate phosphatase
MSRAAFLDRDGVINRKPPEGEYVTRWEELHLLPDVASAILSLNQAGFRAIVVTNQRCIAKGLVSAADVETMHQRMCAELAAKGAKIEKIYYCPHETSPLCSCRKPSPGMLLQAARENGIDMKHSWMIGDSEIDVKAGKSAGCMTARVLSTNESDNSCPDIVGSSLIEVVTKMLSYAPSVGIPTTSK